MRIKMKYATSGGFVRQENYVAIREVMINEDFLHPEHESIAVGFRNKDSSGLIEFSVEEFDKLARTVRKKVHLLKGVRVFDEDRMIKMRK
jgi:hypothetical protein